MPAYLPAPAFKSAAFKSQLGFDYRRGGASMGFLCKANRMVCVAFGITGLAMAGGVNAADEAVTFPANAPLSTLIEQIPGAVISVPWLSGSTVIRYDDAQLDNDKTMPAVRERYAQWCKANGGRIFQPKENNCALLRKSLGCAVGELQYPGLRTDLELGLKDTAKDSKDSVQITWPKASWLISNNTLFNVFANKGANEVSIVGGLQRCMADSRLIGTMAFISINENNDLLFLEPAAYERITNQGADILKAAEAKRKEAISQKQAQAAANIAALPRGSYVIHTQRGWRGMIIEMKPPLAQIQWDKSYGEKTLEWVRLQELSPAAPVR